MTAAGLPAIAAAPRGREAQSTAFFTALGERAVVLGRDEEHGVGVGDGLAQVAGDLGQRVVVVEVLGVVREVGEAGEHRALDPGGEVRDGGVGELVVGGAGAQAADEDEDVHRVLLGVRGGSVQGDRR